MHVSIIFYYDVGWEFRLSLSISVRVTRNKNVVITSSIVDLKSISNHKAQNRCSLKI